VQNDRLLSAWFNDMNRLMADKDQLRQFLDATAKRGLATEWMTFFRAASLVESVPTRDEGLALFDQVIASAKNPRLRAFTFRYYGNALYTLKQFDRVLGLWQLAIKENPENAEVLNNAAYILVKHLNRAADGLPLAEKAAGLAPRSSEVLDTLGLAHLKTGNASKAVEVLERAFGLATSDTAYVTAGLHYAQALAGAGDATKAKEIVQRIGPGFDAMKGNFDEESIATMQNLRSTLQ
jgi:tetratricopeptide (TPR) repeat protein